MQIKIYTKAYVPLTTLLQSRTDSDFNDLIYRETLHQVGDATFTVRLDNVKATLANLKHYNIIEVCEDDGTVRWSGVIVYKRVLENIVSITCFSMIHILTRRLTGADESYSSTTAGAIATALLSNTNGAEDTKITAGTMDDPESVEVTFNYSSIFDALKRITDASGGQFRVKPDRSLNVQAQIGSDLSATVIFQYVRDRIAAANILSFQVEDDGKNITTTSYGESGGNSSSETDSALETEYGLLEEYKNVRELDDQTSLDNATAANNRGSELSPLLQLSPKVPDSFEVGDIVKVILENRIVSINDDYQIIEKTVKIKGGNEREITVRVISNISDLFKQLRDLKRNVDLLNREL